MLPNNKTLQLTIDPAGALAIARLPSASIAAERGHQGTAAQFPDGGLLMKFWSVFH